jgi:hypothetical protein
MKRAIFAILGLFVSLIVGTKTASANEGLVNMRGAGVGSCFSASVYVDGNYKVLMTCRDLRIALSPEKNRYIAWVEAEDGSQKRLGEIVNGKLSTITDVKFVRLFITSEVDSYGNKPLGDVLLAGSIEPIDFGKGIATVPIVTPTPTISPAVSLTTTPKATVTPKKSTSTSDTSSTSSLSSALSTIFKIALFGFGLLLVVVGVFSFLQRRRSL